MAIYNGHEWAWSRTVVWKTIQSTDLTSARPIVPVNPAILYSYTVVSGSLRRTGNIATILHYR